MKVRRSETDVLPLSHPTNQYEDTKMFIVHSIYSMNVLLLYGTVEVLFRQIEWIGWLGVRLITLFVNCYVQ